MPDERHFIQRRETTCCVGKEGQTSGNIVLCTFGKEGQTSGNLVLCTTFGIKEQMHGIPSTGNKHCTAYFGKKERLQVISSRRTAQCIAYLGQVNEDLHALVWPHVCDVAEVGGGRDDPRPPVTPTQHSRTVK